MFWRFGGYASVSAIDTLLDKPDFTLENLLDETELLHEIKQHNSKLIEFLREEPVLAKLLNYVVAPKLEPVEPPAATSAAGGDDGDNDGDDPSFGSDDDKGKAPAFPSFGRGRALSRAMSDAGDGEDDGERRRNRYAYVASEVLASDTWSIYEALMENSALVRNFWRFLERPTPLDPLQASYFTKVNEALFEKKTEDMIELLKSIPNAVSDLLKHVECPMIMDLLLKIIALDRTDGGQGIVEWLYSQDVIPILLSCLSPDRNWVVQTAAGDFIKAIITISANASQNEQQCIGPNELTRQLVSRPCVQQLIQYMLTGGNPLTVGVGIVIEVIRKNNSDYDPDVGADEGSSPSCRDPIYLGTLLRLFADHVPDFMNLIMHAPNTKKNLHSTFGEELEPLGFDRFKTCELMAELLHCSNMGLMNEIGSEELVTARDAERQRLRVEGKLVPRREDDVSMAGDDLTMRFADSGTTHDDDDDSAAPGGGSGGRRLEVTNVAEDDGFEEVEHSREMSEDTSHEFVKAEEEMIPPPVPIPSFFDKDDDDDDLVDEPLSSPRLHVKDDADLEGPQFDDPELVVAPLSPRKKDAEPVPITEVQAVPAAEEKKEDPSKSGFQSFERLPEGEKDVEKDLPSTKEKSHEGDSESSGVATPTTTTESESQPDDDQAKESATPTSKEVKPAEEKSEDVSETTSQSTPPAAPVSSNLPVEATKEVPSQETSASEDASEVLPPAPAPPAPSSDVTVPPVPPRPAQGEDDDTDMDMGGESIIIRAVPDPPFNQSSQAPVRPVVGDYLKMQFVEYKVVPSILTFFFKYPWNNFLHNVVYDVVQQVFNGPLDRGFNLHLAISLFEAADITTAIVRGQVASDASQARTRTRMGYMGHLTLIAEEVVKFTERLTDSGAGAGGGGEQPPESVLEKVMSPGWVDYVEGALAETRERDNAILGGVRPEVAMSNRAAAMSGLAGAGLAGLGGLGMGGGGGGGGNAGSGASAALAEAGLNGSLELSGDGGSNGMGPFAISAGPMMSSGFGSSSDEEDEENEDTDEDVKMEFRSYLDPLNNNGSSSHPPDVPAPPPPPPLNIGPSRARRQLAARLAMHQKAAAAATAAQLSSASSSAAEGEDAGRNGDDDNSGSGIDSLRLDRQDAQREPPQNPFGDDADEIDSDEDDDDNHDGGQFSSAGRGGWWRDVVMGKASGGAGLRNDSDEEVVDDEEFGDFAMPEVESESKSGGAGEGSGSGSSSGGAHDESASTSSASGLKVVKPLAVHPPSNSGGGSGQQRSGFGSIWPFTSQGFGSGGAGKSEEAGEKGEEKSGDSGDKGTAGPAAGGAGEAGVKEEGDKGEGQEKKRLSIEGDAVVL